LSPALWLVLGLGGFHLVYAAFVGLAGDEAYYWQWARHLDWGYYDHPPMVAWLIALGTQLAGHNEFGVRVVTVLLSTAILWLVYCISRDYSALAPSSGEPPAARAGLWAVAVLAAAPLFSLGGFLATPDVPFVFFWTLAVACTLRVLHDRRLHRWLLLGLAFGLGMQSKYPMVLLPLALLIAFAATVRGRTLLRSPGPYLAASVALLVLIPHLFWLARHDYAAVLFQLGHGLGGAGGATGKRLAGVAQFLAGQFGVLTPILFVLFLGALAGGVAALFRRSDRAADSGKNSELALWILVLPAALTLFLFLLASLFAKSQTNWPAAAYPTLAVLLGLQLARWTQRAGIRRGTAYAAVGLAALVSAYAHLEVLYPLVPYTSSVFDKLQDKRGLAQWVEGLRMAAGVEGRQAALLADNYRTASLFAFYLPDRPPTDAPFESGSGSQYTLWRKADDAGAATATAWYVTRFANDPRVPQLFGDARAAGVYVEQRAGVPIGTMYAWYGHLRAANEIGTR
jgi:dolichol-phosphate mannosyltransferase